MVRLAGLLAPAVVSAGIGVCGASTGGYRDGSITPGVFMVCMGSRRGACGTSTGGGRRFGRCTDKSATAEEAAEAAEDVAIGGASVWCTGMTSTRTIVGTVLPVLLGVTVFGGFPPLALSGTTKPFVAD